MSVTSVVAKARPSQLASVIVAAVELRAFAGLALDDVAQILDISQSTVWREWKTAQLWLRREMTARARIERIPRSE